MSASPLPPGGHFSPTGATSDYCSAGNCISGACETTVATTNGTCGPSWGVLLAQIQALGPAAQSMAIVEVGRITAVQENATLVTRPVLARNLAIAALLLVIVEAQRITVVSEIAMPVPVFEPC
ncbi:uncharacterized protein N7518_000193 [Penicillium psychrosexuale]|uniref:uncharacterized protein n=1 Tax=Penicillium psychrosexuale TaxID=1002107 RepID=UPI0025450B06|nr:uncharacterized protein N7518_000193 [Penicillium psychrosexuale]KAJ5803890.1 hypothetical protein N7518_000193 [Penicillium psychrosexuale]